MRLQHAHSDIDDLVLNPLDRHQPFILAITAVGFEECPDLANVLATSAMLKAGADQGATGENAIRYQCKSADIIVGVTGLLNANAMLGEVSPAIAMAISLSEAQKVLVPLERCGLYVAGVGQQRLDSLIREAAHLAASLAGQAEAADE